MKKRTPVEEVIMGSIRPIKDPDGVVRKHFVPRSRNHFLAVCNRFPIDKEMGMIPVEEVNLRSRSQLAYHRVLCRYIAHDQGIPDDDAHDALMKETFGIRKYSLNGKVYEGRHSISDAGGLKVNQVNDLIAKDLETCSFLGLNVPTKKELGYEDTTQYTTSKEKLEYPEEPENLSTEFD